mgnify:CR=1 FL=1
MNKIYAMILALVMSFSLGAYTSSKYVHGQYAQIELEKRNEIERIENAIRSDELTRLRNEAEIDYTLGVILDEIHSDPDGSLPSLSLRDAQTINRIR